MSGAIRLAGEASLRTGAGLVTIGTDYQHADLLNITRPELMVSGIQDVAVLQPLIENASCIAIGPGLSNSAWAKSLLTEVLKSDKPKIVDADALNLLASEAQWQQVRFDNWILTPHPGEAARLLQTTTTSIEDDRYASAEKCVKKWGGICVLKGAGTLIADKQQTVVSSAGNPGMASGGMGDVLTGVIAGFVAQGYALFDAAQLGVTLHAEAADKIALDGERGLLASDLFPVIRELVNPCKN